MPIRNDSLQIVVSLPVITGNEVNFDFQMIGILCNRIDHFIYSIT